MQAGLNALTERQVHDMGTCYKGGATYYHSISENAKGLKNDYEYSEGYFGHKGMSDNSHVRNIPSSTPIETAISFYDRLTFGGVQEPIYDKKSGTQIGSKTKMSDGSIISYRPVSSSDGTPAIDINIEKSSDSGGIKMQKIHFVIGE